MAVNPLEKRMTNQLVVSSYTCVTPFGVYSSSLLLQTDGSGGVAASNNVDRLMITSIGFDRKATPTAPSPTSCLPLPSRLEPKSHKVISA